MDANWYQQGGTFVREFLARVGGRWAPTILAELASSRMAMAAGVMMTSVAATTANAYEFGSPGFELASGFLLGLNAAALPPGWYGDDRLGTYQAHLVGPGAPADANGSATRVKADVLIQSFVWSSGWTFLGGAYEAAIVQPVVSANVGSPVYADLAGIHNTAFLNQLSWKLGDSGFFLKTALFTWAPTGTQGGANGLGNVGNPWWTFQPAVLLSYLKDGWSITANLSDEINTDNTITHYRSGDVLHAELTATKSIGRWSIGPVAYYSGQITNDRSSAFYNGAINVNRYDIWAAGGMVGYNFGPVLLNVWALQEFSTASGGTAGPPGVDTAAITKGVAAFASLTYPLGAPDAPASPTLPRFHK